MDSEGWVAEMHELWPGQKFCLQMKRQLFHEKSPYQDLRVFESQTYGTVLTLDGIIQCTERDEAAYSEMMAHVPLCSLKVAPKRVLVIGGGDGGVVRELTKYRSIERIDVAEIDKMVVDVAKRFLPKMSIGFEDPRVELRYCDGCEFVKNASEGSYDAVIIDSSDPVGPALSLYKKPFYEAIHRALKPGGVACCMAECMWLHMEFIRETATNWASVFSQGSVSYGYTCTPSYPCGQIGILLSMKGDPEQSAVSPLVPKKLHYEDGSEPESVAMQYYSAEIHSACFTLPEFAKKALSGILTFQ